MGSFMLDISCGISGSVRIVRKNSVTGEVTGDFEFKNAWTTAGLAGISGSAFSTKPLPDGLTYGSGSRSDPHENVTSLASYVGKQSISWSRAPTKTSVSGNTRTCSATSTITVPKRGVAWTLSELGLVYGSTPSVLRTYALVKNIAGVPTPVQVSDIEILTIYYTVQIQYPIQVIKPLEVTGLPPTTVTFNLNTFTDISSSAWYAARFYMQGYQMYGTVPIDALNGIDIVGAGTWSSSGVNHNGGNVAFDPPMRKNNTQVLTFSWTITFTNATPIEIP